ncbi:MAG: T9SS type A sorting domain-containing protein [Hymenobacteraceae bacterium]|nr:T9SS type A sorting domain-containing protein [Hymenobacteraceae bacterium]
MKNSYLCGLLLVAGIPTGALAQSLKSVVDRAALRGVQPIHHQVSRLVDTGQQAGPLLPAAVPTAAAWGKMVGFTTYDLQTNRGSANRVALTGSRVSMVWTQSCQIGSAPAYPNRGVGYNESVDGGSTFLDSASHCAAPSGIASVRTGWPELLHVNGQDVVLAHTGSGIVRIARTLGTTSWNTSSVLPFTIIQSPTRGTTFGTWPRAVASGTTVHLLYTDNGSTTGPTQQPSGLTLPTLYARSPDGGLTWNRTGITLPQFDSTNFRNANADAYAIGVNGNAVAVTAGAFGSNTVIAKSTDGGDTFTTTRLMGPFTAADTVQVSPFRSGSDTATVVVSDGSMNVVVDHTGTAHWFSGAQLVQVILNHQTGYFEPNGEYYPDKYPGLLYWNDRELVNSKPLIAAVTDSFVHAGASFSTLATGTSVGQSSDTYGAVGAISMPTATVNTNGDVYCVYASGMRGTSNDGTPTGQYYRDLYLFKISFPGNGTVLAYVPKNISRDLRGIAGGASSRSEESVFPSVAHEIVDNTIHYQWMSDFEPGTALLPGQNPDPEVESAIMYDTIGVTNTMFTQVARILTGQPLGVATQAAAYVSSVSAVPNPTTGRLLVHLTLHQATRASIVVRDVLGREMVRLPATNLTKGANTAQLDLSHLPSGIYFYSVQADRFTLTERVVKN